MPTWQARTFNSTCDRMSASWTQQSNTLASYWLILTVRPDGPHQFQQTIKKILNSQKVNENKCLQAEQLQRKKKREEKPYIQEYEIQKKKKKKLKKQFQFAYKTSNASGRRYKTDYYLIYKLEIPTIQSDIDLVRNKV